VESHQPGENPQRQTQTTIPAMIESDGRDHCVILSTRKIDTNNQAPAPFPDSASVDFPERVRVNRENGNPLASSPNPPSSSLFL